MYHRIQIQGHSHEGTANDAVRWGTVLCRPDQARAMIERASRPA